MIFNNEKPLFMAELPYFSQITRKNRAYAIGIGAAYMTYETIQYRIKLPVLQDKR